MKFNSLDYTKPWIRDLCCYTPGKTIKGFIKLASNENNYGPSPQVKEALKKGIEDLNIYPYRDSEVREKIAGYCNTEKDGILLGNGSDELFDIIYKTFKDPALSFNPTYSEYRIFEEALGGRYLQVNLKKDFTFPLEEYIKKSKEANLLVLCSPNNPTGGTITEKELTAVLDQGKITLLDEAYVEFNEKTMIDLVKEYDNLIILRTFSKAFALAGLRIGYAVANQELIEAMGKVKPPFSVNSLALVAAEAAIESKDYMKKNVEKIKNDREKIYKELKKKYRTFKSQSNFILADVSPSTSDEVYRKLLEKKIIVRNLGKFENFEGEYIRVSVGTQEENKAFIEALDDL